MIDVMVRPVLEDGPDMDWETMQLGLICRPTGGLSVSLQGHVKWKLPDRRRWSVVAWELVWDPFDDSVYLPDRVDQEPPLVVNTEYLHLEAD